MKRKTPSFVTELPLVVDGQRERVVLARLEAARQVYNACLGEALKRREALLHSRLYQAARTMKRDKARTAAFAEACEAVGFQEYNLHGYAGQFGHRWLGDHLDSLTVQKLASRAFSAVEQYHFGKRGKPRFKTYNQLDSVEGKNNASGLLWREALDEHGAPTGVLYLVWKGLVLYPTIDDTDPVIRHGLSARVKYVRLVRRKLNGRNRFYVQLVCEGLPYRKEKHKLGRGRVGLDIGPSTVAGVSDSGAFLQQFCEELQPRNRKLRRLQRKLDRQRRANNPDNYHENGTVKAGQKTWHKSNSQQKTEKQIAELHRKLAAHRKSLHGRLVNHILAQGDDIRIEKLSYRAFQRRFGRSVACRAPGTFVELLKRKAASAGAAFTEFSTYTTRLSQTCHQCGQVRKKPLSQRWHECACGVSMQRDLYSAFLATCVENQRLNADQAKRAWSGADTLLRAALSAAQQQLASGQAQPASFGLGQRQSQSSRKSGREIAKAQGAVGQRVTPLHVDALSKG